MACSRVRTLAGLYIVVADAIPSTGSPMSIEDRRKVLAGLQYTPTSVDFRHVSEFYKTVESQHAIHVAGGAGGNVCNGERHDENEIILEQVSLADQEHEEVTVDTGMAVFPEPLPSSRIGMEVVH